MNKKKLMDKDDCIMHYVLSNFYSSFRLHPSSFLPHMSERKWLLTDVARGVGLTEFSVSSADRANFTDAAEWFPGDGEWSLAKKTLRGGVSDGVDVVEIHNGRLSVSVLPTRGMGLWRGSFEGLELGWKSPVALPVHPAFVNPLERGGIGWLHGFNEWFCRCGLDSNGPPGRDSYTDAQGHKIEALLNLHGRIANLAAHHVEVGVSPEGSGRIFVTGIVDETSMFGPCLP